MKSRKFFNFCLLVCFCIVKATALSALTPTMTIHIPMRDKVELPTDIYLPYPDAKNLPCILVRSPAGREAYQDVFAPLAMAGYVVAIQSTRSNIDTEGKTFPYVSDGWGVLQDGYDTVAWLSHNPLTNGSIGTFGFSAMGITQLLMAPTKPPGLDCQYIGMAVGSLYHHAIYAGGPLMKNQVEGWLGHYARDPSVLNHVLNCPSYNEFWRGMDTLPLASQVTVPALFYGGWYDTFSQGTLDAFVSRQENGGVGAKGCQKLIMGPWTHYWPKSFQLGDFEVPNVAKMPPVDISPLKWFDHYLKKAENGIEELPAVTYYVMGPFDGSSSSGNVWRTADRWPVPSVETALYLDSKGGLKSQLSENSGDLTYKYDPTNPVPTIGGHNLFLESGPKDQRPLEARDDVLVFTSEPLLEDLEVTGRMKAKLFVMTNQQQTDVAVRICDVYPDGRSILISDGMSRLQVPIKSKNEPCEVDVDLWSTSMVFAKGHCIRISVTGSNHPRFEKNLGLISESAAESDLKPSQNRLFLGKLFPSQITLPIVPLNNEKTVISHKKT